MNTKDISTPFIEDLVEWIEQNLDDSPTLDMVSKVSGYSKWHLQRKFRALSGMQLASYVRNRRLTKAAFALKMTSAPIIDISTQNGFESQQTFTRTFKKRFGITPHQYRISEIGHNKNLVPRFSFSETFEISVETVHYPQIELLGVMKPLTARVDAYDECTDNALLSMMAEREEMISDFIHEMHHTHRKIYGVFQCEAVEDNQLQVSYSPSIENDGAARTREWLPLTIAPDKYLSIEFEGDVVAARKFALYLFRDVLPTLREEQGTGLELEIIQIKSGELEDKLKDVKVNYRYLLACL